MSQIIVGVFETLDQANHAKQQLLKAGCTRDDIQVHAISDSESSSYSSSVSSDTRDSGDSGSFMERVKHFFSSIFSDDEDEYASHYTEAVRRGHAVLSVPIEDDNDVKTASQIMNNAGAINIDAKVSQWQQSGYTGYDASAQPFTREQMAAERANVIPVIKEELEVGKRQVNLGSVRVHSRMVETPVSEQVNLKEEHAAIKRRPVDRLATEEDLQAFQDKSIEVQETAEKAVVSKQARVIEEVEVGTEETSTTENIEDTLHSTEVDVERDPNLRANTKKDRPRPHK